MLMEISKVLEERQGEKGEDTGPQGSPTSCGIHVDLMTVEMSG